MAGPRRLACFVAVLLSLWLCLPTGVVRAEPARWNVPPAPRLGAGSAIVMDWETGEILYTKDAYSRRDPASTTKVLTALIVLERAKLNDQVKVSPGAANTPGSSMHIRAGEVYSVHDLLHGLLLRSGNDAAVALAEHVAGSVEAFAVLMNEKARALGAKGSHFVNPHGLTNAQHYSTAYDLAVITSRALRDERFAGIVAQRQRPLTYENLGRQVVLHNTNALLAFLPGADGVKTGTTAAAGRCLIASATRDEQRLMAVVLRAGNRFGEAATLLSWAFDNFRLARLGRQGEVVASVPVRLGRRRAVSVELAHDLALVLPRKSAETPRLEVRIDSQLRAPLRRGQLVGKAVVTDGNAVRAESDLVAAHDVQERRLIDWLMQPFVPLIRWTSAADFL